jgi:hypothetical protein
MEASDKTSNIIPKVSNENRHWTKAIKRRENIRNEARNRAPQALLFNPFGGQLIYPLNEVDDGI